MLKDSCTPSAVSDQFKDKEQSSLSIRHECLSYRVRLIAISSRYLLVLIGDNKIHEALRWWTQRRLM